MKENEKELVWFYQKSLKKLTDNYKKEFDANVNRLINDYRTGTLIKNFNDSKITESMMKSQINKSVIETNEPDIKLLGIGGFGTVFKISDTHCIKISLEDKVKNQKNTYHEYSIPRKLIELDPELNNSLIVPLFLLKNKSFNNIINVIYLNFLTCKIIYSILKKTKHNIILDISNLEIRSEYSFIFSPENKKKSVELYNYIYENYFNPKFQIGGVFSCLKQMLNLFKKNKEMTAFYMLMPLAEDISTNVFLNPKTLQIDKKGVKGRFLNKNITRMLFLQVSIALLKMYKYKYVHNDLKPDNVLVLKKNKPYTLTWKNNVFLFEENYIFKISDFDFSVVPEIIDNKKIVGTSLANLHSWFNDIHYFIHKLFIYLDKEDIFIDMEFFEKLHSTFILPYCQCEMEKMYKKTLIKFGNIVICNDGFYFYNKLPSIEILENFILSSLFSDWRRNEDEVESLLSSLKLEKLDLKEYEFDCKEVDVDYFLENSYID